jgi:hypothetical protein
MLLPGGEVMHTRYLIVPVVLASLASCRRDAAPVVPDPSPGQAASSASDQFVFIDQRVTWESMQEVTRKGPPDLTSPIDYYRQGRLFLRFDLLEKPSDFPMGVQVCMWGDGGSETCSQFRKHIVRDKGTYYMALGAPESWWTKDGGVDWSGRPWKHLRVNLRCPDDSDQPACIFARGHYKKPEQHFPIVYHATAIFVAPGKNLQAPAGWECPAEWNCE